MRKPTYFQLMHSLIPLTDWVPPIYGVFWLTSSPLPGIHFYWFAIIFQEKLPQPISFHKWFLFPPGSQNTDTYLCLENLWLEYSVCFMPYDKKSNYFCKSNVNWNFTEKIFSCINILFIVTYDFINISGKTFNKY